MTDETTPGKKDEVRPPPPEPTATTAPSERPILETASAAHVASEAAATTSSGAARFAWLLAIIGVIALGATGFFAWQLSQRPVVVPSYGALEQRLAQMEVQLAAAREAAARPHPAAPAAAGNGAMESRLEAIEAARDELTRKLETLVGQVGRTAQQMEASRETSGPAVAALTAETKDHLQAVMADLATLRSRVDGLRGEIATPIEQRLASAEQRMAAFEARPAPVLPDPQALYQIALDDLGTRIESGRPFSGAWRTVLAFSRSEEAVKPAGEGWIDRSESGIPTTETLAARFTERAAAVSGAASGESWMDKAIDRASRLVSVRRVDADLPGTTPEAITGRAQAKLEAGDTAAALAEVEALPAASKERLGTWIEDARARVAAEAALATLEKHTVPAGRP